MRLKNGLAITAIAAASMLTLAGCTDSGAPTGTEPTVAGRM